VGANYLIWSVDVDFSLDCENFIGMISLLLVIFTPTSLFGSNGGIGMIQSNSLYYH
jgi:hypothetical protein